MATGSPHPDHLEDVPMEISSNFFPPPNIELPVRGPLLLPPTLLRIANWTFHIERQTISRYEEEFSNRGKPIAGEHRGSSSSAQLGDEVGKDPSSGQDAAFDSTQQSCLPDISASNMTAGQQEGVSPAPTLPPELKPIPVMSPEHAVLIDSLVLDNPVQKANQTYSATAQKTGEDNNKTLHSQLDWGEFVLRDSIFDIVARSSINERDELARLLS